MFFRKLITYFLLLAYGLPVGLGPHWHSHGHFTTDSCFAVHKDCGCSCGQLVKEIAALHEPHSVFRASVSGSACDGCAICNFYAASQLHHSAPTVQDTDFACDHISFARSTNDASSIWDVQVRGPPM